MDASVAVLARIISPTRPLPPPPFVLGAVLTRKLTSTSRPTDWKT
jgi:hypothetical protein